MIATLAIWAYILFILFGYGLGIFVLLQRVFRIEKGEHISLPLLLLLGLSAVNFLAALLSLLLPLSLTANMIILLGASVLFYKYRKDVSIPSFKWDITTALVFLIASLIVLENGTHTPSNPDTALYHSQAIHWIEDYRAVPGLGNLHTRLAFNSNWLVLNALFSFSFLHIQSFHVLPGLFFLIFILHLLPGVSATLRGEFSLSNLFKVLLIPISFHIWAAEISSPGTDLPASLLIWFVISLWLDARDREDKFLHSLILVLAFTAITFKLSAFPLLLLPGYDAFVYVKQKKFNIALNLVLIGSLLLVPWLIRNFIVSGYWVYPAPAVMPLSPNVEWRIPGPTVNEEARNIQRWARQFNVKEESPKYPWEWIPSWLERLTNLQRLMFWTSFLLLPLYGLIAIFDKRARNMAYVCCYIGVLFWLLSAPNIRFGYGFLIAADLLVMIPILLFLLKHQIYGVAINGIAVLYLFTIFTYSFEASTFAKRLALPEPYAEAPTATCNLANAVIQCAEKYNLCGYSAFPCAPKAYPDVEMRGESWQDGFRTIQP